MQAFQTAHGLLHDQRTFMMLPPYFPKYYADLVSCSYIQRLWLLDRSDEKRTWVVRDFNSDRKKLTRDEYCIVECVGDHPDQQQCTCPGRRVYNMVELICPSTPPA